MDLANPTFRLNLTATVLDPFPVAGGNIEVGTRVMQKFPDTANFAIASKIFMGANNESVTFDLDTFAYTVSSPSVAQVETATCAGTVTASGVIGLTLTSNLLTLPLIIGVPVLVADTASAWALKARTVLGANEKVKALFRVSGSGTSIVLTARTAAYNDPALNLAIANGTAAGITAAPTSATTTAGFHGVQIQGYTGNGKDAYGQDLPTLPYIHALLINVLSGPPGSSLKDIGSVTATQSTLRPGSSYVVTNIPTVDLAANTIRLGRQGTGNTPLCVELVIIGGPTPL